MHIGLGAFHRAHLAWYTDLAMSLNRENWMIAGASLFSSAVPDSLSNQDNLYTVSQHGTDGSPGNNTHVVGSIGAVIFAKKNPAQLIKYLCAQQTKIVSLTITEKGYCYDSQNGCLNTSNPDIKHDLSHPGSPITAIGFIVAALSLRRDNKKSGFTLLSCDNLPSNGKVLQRVVSEFATIINPALAQWINTHVSFPCTMVDRIVPAIKPAGLAQVQSQLGLIDKAAIITEAFSQWVVEDDFIRGRPPWEKVGVVFSDEVSKFEQMKLRLLNGAHSAMAYLGVLAKLKNVSDCMQHKSLQRFIVNLMQQEIASSIAAPKGYDVDLYINTLIKRFSNAQLNHSCAQIAADGSEKLPQRLLPVIEIRLQQNLKVNRLCLVISAWMYFTAVEDSLVDDKIVTDPLLSTYDAINADSSTKEIVSQYLAINSVFSSYLQSSEQFETHLVYSFNQLRNQNMALLLEEF